MSGRTAKRLRKHLAGLPDYLRTRRTLSQLKRGWEVLTGEQRGEGQHASTILKVGRVYNYRPVTTRAMKRGGAGMLLRGRPRTGGPAKRPGRAWLRARRERLAEERGAR